jgi:hypothetical protein
MKTLTTVVAEKSSVKPCAPVVSPCYGAPAFVMNAA